MQPLHRSLTITRVRSTSSAEPPCKKPKPLLQYQLVTQLVLSSIRTQPALTTCRHSKAVAPQSLIVTQPPWLAVTGQENLFGHSLELARLVCSAQLGRPASLSLEPSLMPETGRSSRLGRRVHRKRAREKQNEASALHQLIAQLHPLLTSL